MDLNATLIGQSLAFALFVLFCMKFVWPLLIEAMRERQRVIAEGLEKANQAEKELEKAQDVAGQELDQAKQQAAELIRQANQRASQIVEDARSQARGEGERLIDAAHAQIEQERNRVREELRVRVSELAVVGAERILEASVDRSRHEDMLNKLAADL